MKTQLKKPLPARPNFIGILNLTQDSFSDGGDFYDFENALRHAKKLHAEGADILDIGGESTRPGAQPISQEAEAKAVLPVLEVVRQQIPELEISIDTRNASTAREAIKLGARIVNDISALRHDPEMAPLLASKPDVKVILMHMQGIPQTMQNDPHYDDVVAEVDAFFAERIDFALSNDILRENILLDPGIGFGKTAEHNYTILGALSHFKHHGLPLVLGASRKRFLEAETGAGPKERLGGSLAAAWLAFSQGVEYLRIHDVLAHRQFFNVLEKTLEGMN